MPTIEHQVLLVKTEAPGVGYGVDPTASGIDAIRVTEPAYKLAPSMYMRSVASDLEDPYFTDQIGNLQPSITFKQALRGHSSPLSALVKPTPLDLWSACGWVSTWDTDRWTSVWDPDHATSLWMELESGGLLQVARGCRGSFELEMTPGQMAMASYTFEGLYGDVSDRVVTAPTYVNANPWRVESASFYPYGDIIGAGEFGRVTKATLQTRGNIYRATDVNGDQGVSEIHVLQKGTKGDMGALLTLEVTMPAGADAKRWWRRFLDRTESAACSFTLGSSTVGAKQTLTAQFARLAVQSIEDTKQGELFSHKVVCKIQRSLAGTTNDSLDFVWIQH